MTCFTALASCAQSTSDQSFQRLKVKAELIEGHGVGWGEGGGAKFGSMTKLMLSSIVKVGGALHMLNQNRHYCILLSGERYRLVL